MKVKVEKVAGVELEGKQLIKIEFSFESGLVIEKSTTEITLPVGRFSERLMLETLKTEWKARRGVRKRVGKISKKILGKEYEI